MAELKIRLATWDYDRVRPILDGRVKIERCTVDHIVLPPEECFRRAYELREFEVSEIGLVPYIIARSRGLAPYEALPVFLSRMFRHSAIYIRTDRGIHSPTDLEGKIIGVVEYQMSAGMWCRGMLADDFGLDLRGIIWRQGGVNVPGRKEKFPLNLPEGFPLKPIPEGRTLSELLAEGSLDAVISPEPPLCFGREGVPVDRLFKDYESAEKDYFMRHGHFPIMHALGVRNDVHAQHPWLANNLYRSFLEAKKISDRDLFDMRAPKIGLPWIASHAQATCDLMGHDFWPYGIEMNRRTLELMVRYAHDQGLSARPQTLEELFLPLDAAGAL